jgi:hypothetical protein
MTIRTLVEADLTRVKAIDQPAFSAGEQYEDGTYWSKGFNREEILEARGRRSSRV